MPFHYHIRHLFCSLLLLVFGLSSCQRATYSFQPVSVAPVAAAALPLPDTTIAWAAARPTPASPGIGLPRSVRASHRRQSARNTAPRPALLPLAATIAARRPAAARLALPHRPLLFRSLGSGHTRAPQAAPHHVHHRSKTVALLLAVLLGPFGAHRFYLGYYGQGAIYLGLMGLTMVFLLLGLFSFLTFTAPFAGFLAVAVGLSIIVEGWLISDIVRILTDDLKPRNGEY